jgi:hypothetical protein
MERQELFMKLLMSISNSTGIMLKAIDKLPNMPDEYREIFIGELGDQQHVISEFAKLLGIK